MVKCQILFPFLRRTQESQLREIGLLSKSWKDKRKANFIFLNSLLIIPSVLVTGCIRVNISLTCYQLFSTSNRLAKKNSLRRQKHTNQCKAQINNFDHGVVTRNIRIISLNFVGWPAYINIIYLPTELAVTLILKLRRTNNKLKKLFLLLLVSTAGIHTDLFPR